MKPSRVRWVIFSLAVAISWLLYLHRYAFSYIKPMLAEEWGLSKTQLGQLDSAFAITYSVFQFPLAILADIFGVHLILVLLMILWCGGLAWIAGASSIGQMWYAQLSFGAGQSAVYACLSRISRVWYPASIRTTLQGAVGVMAGRLGALSTSLIFAAFLLGMVQLDWRSALWVLVAVGVVLTLVFAFVFRNSPNRHPLVNEMELSLIAGPAENGDNSSKPKRADSLFHSLNAISPRSMVNLTFISLQTILSTFADNLFSNWLPLFLFQVHQLELKSMGIFASLPLLGGALAGFLAGFLNDRCIAITGNRRWSRAAVAMAGKSMAGILMLLALVFYHNPYAFCLCLFFVKLFGDWSLTSLWGVVTDIGGRTTASVFALVNSLAGIGFFAAPQVFGFVADQYGWQPVFVMVAITYFLCAATWLMIDCTRPVVDKIAGT